MSDTTFVSPDDLFAAAKAAMFDGQDPANAKEEAMVVQYWAAAIVSDVAEAACLLLCVIYGFSLSEQDVTENVALALGTGASS